MKTRHIVIIVALFLLIFQGCDKSALENVHGEDEYTLKNVDLSDVSEEQKTVMFEVLRSFPCPCGCGKSDLVVCRNSDDENCKTSQKLAELVKRRVKAGDRKENIMKLVGDNVEKTKERIRIRKERYNKVYDIDITDAYYMGKEDAIVTLIVFSDFQCPYCTKAYAILEPLAKEFSKELKIVMMHNPLAMHPDAEDLAIAAEAAGRQGKYFEMTSLLFRKKGKYSVERMAELAKQLGIDTDKFKKDMQDEEVIKRVFADKEQAKANHITGTPTMILNKRMIKKKYTYQFFQNLIRNEIKKVKAASSAK